MRSTLHVLVVAAALAACGDVGTAERLSSSEALDGIDVPTIGTVGDFPDPAHRHVVNVTADGRIVVEGRVLTTYGRLCEELARLGKLSVGDAILGTSPVKHLSGESFVLRVDRSATWATTVLAMAACSEANAERVFFAVRHESGGGDGAVGSFLPLDVGCGDDGRVLSRRVRISPGVGAATPADLVGYIGNSSAAQTRGLRLTMNADPAATTGAVLGFFDAVLRSEAEFGGFALPALPRLDAATPLAAATSPQTPQSAASIRIDDINLRVDPTAQMPPIARIRGGLAGIATSWHTSVREEPPAEPSVLKPR